MNLEPCLWYIIRQKKQGSKLCIWCDLIFVSMFERVNWKDMFTKLLTSVTPGQEGCKEQDTFYFTSLFFYFRNNFLYL